jgi:hypothetical protein
MGGAVIYHDTPEREAAAWFYALPPSPQPHTPETPDPLRDGLLRGWKEARNAR